MKKLFFLSFFLSPCFSQNAVDVADQIRVGCEPILNQMEEKGPFFFRIYAHRIRQSDGDGGQPDFKIIDAIQRMREHFKPHNIFFSWDCEIKNVDNDNFYDWGFNPNFSALEASSDVDYDLNGVNIFFFPDSPSDGSILSGGGWARDIGGGNAIYLAGTDEANADTPYDDGTPIIETTVLSHEMGHCLGLLHTHHNSTGSGGSPDIPQFGPCLTSNDCLCDTSEDPNLDGNVDSNCTHYPDEGDEIYSPSIHNMMSYSFKACRTHFTANQGKRMRNVTTFLDLQGELLDRENIETNTVWTEDVNITGSIEIQPGASLTIMPTVTVRFAEEARLVINENATLNLRGTLTSLDCDNCSCDNTWKGVEIRGDADANQDLLNQGRIITSTGAIIENADVAINLKSFIPNYSSITDTYSGGIVKCTGTLFKNNRLAVNFPPYSKVRNNKSFFTNCEFLTDEDYDQFAHNSIFEGFAKLVGVNGVDFRGCSFNNQQVSLDVDKSLHEYGYGIQSINAGFNVIPLCTNTTYPCESYQRSSFTGLTYGIYNISPFSIKSKTYKVRQADFTDNYFGVYVNSVDNGTILHNDFYLGNIPNPSVFSGDTEQVGIMFENNIAGFTFEENDFIGVGGNVDITVGSICKNIGRFNNVVRRNNYEGVDIGNLALGENGAEEDDISRGLQYFCNDNINVNIHDFYVSNQTGTATIRTEQRLDDFDVTPPFRATGNTFSFTEGFDFFNEGVNLNYYYDDDSSEQTPLTFSGFDIFNAQSNLCPEDYCEPPCKTASQLQVGKGKYYEDRTKKDLAKTEQEQAILEGNTVLAQLKEKEAARYRKEMDKEAFMVVLHLVTDTISLDEDSLSVWVENLDLFSMDMFFSFKQQEGGNIATAQKILEQAGKRENLSYRERETLSEMPALLKIIARKNSENLNRTQLKELEKLAEDDESFVGNISRNLLILHGYQYTPVFGLPKSREVAVFRNSETLEKSTKISVFPNPAKNFITIQNLSENTKNLNKENFRIINSEGKVVKEFSLSSGESRTLETADFRTGLYFYQLFSNEETFEIGKFLIQ